LMRRQRSSKTVITALTSLFTIIFFLTGCGGGGSSSSTALNTTSTTANNYLSGTYGIVTAGSIASYRTTTQGTISFDGAGNVGSNGTGLSNTYTLASGTVLSSLTNFTGGTYTASTDRSFSADITTNSGRITVTSGKLATTQGIAAGTFVTTDVVPGMFILAKPVTSAGVLVGTWQVSIVLMGANPGYATGTFNFDSSGNITGGTLTQDNGATIGIDSGTWPVAADGSATGTLNLTGGGTATLNGFASIDGTMIFTLTDSTGTNLGTGVATSGPGSAYTSNMSGTLSFFSFSPVPSPGGFVRGTLGFDGLGTINSGSLVTYGANSAGVTRGTYTVSPTGTVNTLSIDTNNGTTTSSPSWSFSHDKQSMSGVMSDNMGKRGFLMMIP